MSDETHPQVTIRVEGLSLHTNHGVTEEERVLGQRMVFDVKLVMPDCGATATDDVTDTVDYGEVTELVASLATAESRQTLERLVQVIATELADRYPVSSVTVRATKPEPPIPFETNGTSVEVTIAGQAS
jgi:dihydroneopterin aldolase